GKNAILFRANAQAGQAPPLARLARDWKSLAYNPPEDKRVPSDEAAGPPRLPERRPSWLDPFLRPLRPPNPDQDEAAFQLDRYEIERQQGVAALRRTIE